ncbi:hypothetical protein [Caballeronia sp. BR00000012568055]|uniref:hypothetical protein n=1 Tax=Caballeronia sp. BR00000012568055 TaxID=2918761 RepID=UPI0023F7199B|nr:hypothetical protein [Caballeronia sp. BR00000012568055]
MRVRISNEGEHPVRVIVDHDNANDATLEAEAEEVYDAAQGIVGLRELDAGTDPSDEPADTGSTT